MKVPAILCLLLATTLAYYQQVNGRFCVPDMYKQVLYGEIVTDAVTIESAEVIYADFKADVAVIQQQFSTIQGSTFTSYLYFNESKFYTDVVDAEGTEKCVTYPNPGALHQCVPDDATSTSFTNPAGRTVTVYSYKLSTPTRSVDVGLVLEDNSPFVQSATTTFRGEKLVISQLYGEMDTDFPTSVFNLPEACRKAISLKEAPVNYR